MITLRPYQTQMVEAFAKALARFERVIGVAPTASGKSIIIAGIAKRYLDKNPDHRVLILTHMGELLLQNESKLRGLGIKSTGVYCAGMGRKETTRQVTLASRDSLGRNPSACGHFQLVIVDEAHLVGEEDATLYQRIFVCIQPRFIVGLTGTPWRADNGLVYGKGKFWQACADRIEMEAIRDAGYLAPYVLPPITRTLIDTSSVKVTAGEFNSKQLTIVSSAETVVRACVSEWWMQAQDRRSTLFFCCSRAHAEVVVRVLAEYTHSIAYLDGTTAKGEREHLMNAAKGGGYRAIVNVGVLTTGVDIPVLDCICFLRATQSVSLYVQMAGRGLRVCEGKTDCLMLDFAGNFERFGPIEHPRPPKGKSKIDVSDIEAMLAAEGADLLPGTAPVKSCPACDHSMHAAATRCENCGHVFFNHGSQTMTSAELAQAGIYQLMSIHGEESVTRKGAACFIVEYRTECGKDYKEWLFPKTPGYQKWLAEQKIAVLRRGATHVRVLLKDGETYPKLQPLKLQSSVPFSLICLTSESLPGDKTMSASTTRREALSAMPWDLKVSRTS